MRDKICGWRVNGTGFAGVWSAPTQEDIMRSQFLLASLVVPAALSGCLGALPGPEVPEGYPALEFGDGAHGVWTHGDEERDLVARIGIIEVDGAASLLIKGEEDDPSVALRFGELEEAELETVEGSLDPLIIATDEEGELWSDMQSGGHAVLTIDHLDDRVVAGSFEGTVCAFDDDTSEVLCDEIEGGRFSAVDDRDLQD